MIVPARFATELVSAEGAAAAAWLDGLPALAERYLQRWRLVPAGEPVHGATALVLPVRGAGGVDAVLKLGWPHPESAHEALALRIWGGRGAVRLLDCDERDGVLLLDRLDAAVSLDSVPAAEAVQVLAGLLRRLSVPAPAGLRSMAAVARRWRDELPAEAARLGGPVPARLLVAAVAACDELGPSAGTAMVNEDLHYSNVLRSRAAVPRGSGEAWLVIDPKVLAGDPGYGVFPMLWNRFEETGGVAGLPARFAAVVTVAGLDATRARGWTLLRAVDTWLWTLARGGFPQAAACAAIARWALGG